MPRRFRSVHSLIAFCMLVFVALVPSVSSADISGTVKDLDTEEPIEGARVHVQADPDGTVVITGADGTFTLPINPVDPVIITAGVPYDPDATDNWTTNGLFSPVANGTTDVEIFLPKLPAADDPDYEPLTIDNSCSSCHGNQVADWMGTSHSIAAVDPWVLDLYSGTGTPGGSAGYVFRDTHDPDNTGFCATCHTPIAEAFNPGGVFLDEVTDPAALEGVSCIACHQIADVNENVDALHLLGNATYRFPEPTSFPTSQYVWGSLDDVTFGGMRASYNPVFADSRFCASCHQYNNPFTGAPGQNTYGEWLESPFAQAGPGFQSCQDCHMAELPPAQVCTQPFNPTRPSEQNHSHAFPTATAMNYGAAIDLTMDCVEENGTVRVTAAVENFGLGHAFPTGVSIRNALLVVEATWNGQTLSQIAGPTIPFYGSDDVPGVQPGDYAGQPGKGFAKVLEGRINGQGPTVRPVLFIDAEGVFEDTLIPAGETDVSELIFSLPSGAEPGDSVEVTARVLYRRAWRALAVTKGWTETPLGGPIELEVASADSSVTLIGSGAGILEIPTLGTWGLGLLASLLAVAGAWALRRR
ncbi:MAG: IPTL-CTERM sorting domain-containing protein [Acidobacteriota bacterium]